MPQLHSALRVAAPLLAALALAGCGGGTSFPWSGSTGANPAAPSAPPVNLAGRWLLSSPSRGQCHMTFGAASPAAIDGTIAPEGGCPGKFYMSRKWSYEQGNLVMRDHTGQPLAQLSGEGAAFNGKATTGEPVTLMR